MEDLEDLEGNGVRDEIISDEEDMPDHHQTYNSIEEEREANAAMKAASRLAKEEQGDEGAARKMRLPLRGKRDGDQRAGARSEAAGV